LEALQPASRPRSRPHRAARRTEAGGECAQGRRLDRLIRKAQHAVLAERPQDAREVIRRKWLVESKAGYACAENLATRLDCQHADVRDVDGAAGE